MAPSDADDALGRMTSSSDSLVDDSLSLGVAAGAFCDTIGSEMRYCVTS